MLKCQILFSGKKNKKHANNLQSVEFAQGVIKINQLKIIITLKAALLEPFSSSFSSVLKRYKVSCKCKVYLILA